MGSLLFSPFELRELTLGNRIVVSPMGQCSAENGSATGWHMMHVGSMAISGAGLVIIEATAVHADGRHMPHDLGLWCDDNAAALEPVIALCRKHGRAKLGIQLWHAGRKGSVSVSWKGQTPLRREDGGWTVRAASDIPYPGRLVPEPLTEDGIRAVIASYVGAAKRADALGLDLLEIHGAHGYLIHNFLSPLANHRADGYGGSRAGRMRFALEVFAAVREVWPARKPMGMRISSTDWAPGGWDIEDSVELAQALRKLGCDYITASSGGSVAEQKIPVAPGYQVPFAERIRREAGIPTMAIGLITQPRQAEAILASGSADLVALARGMLSNPRWPWDAAIELGEEIPYPPQYERAHPSMRGGDFLKPRREG